ncbi:MAG: cation:proton antiporter [Bacteroidales bacterium]|nr:cation:proton antiporter [Bacteroidales bacterium]
MNAISEFVIFFAAFAIIAIASGQISEIFRKIKLPLITGLIIIGIIAGPDVLHMIPREAIPRLHFIDDVSLAFIALAVGTELYLKEMRSRLGSITYMTISQLLVTFILGGLAFYFFSGMIPFMKGMNEMTRLAVALLAGTIFVARSPASAIAIVNEMRASGPFTQTALGVTVVKDFLVIILFSVVLSISESLVNGGGMTTGFLFVLLVEIGLSAFLGYLLSKLIALFLSISGKTSLKMFLVLASGYSVYLLSYGFREFSSLHFGFEIYIEPLLACILGSFLLTNYSKYRPDFVNIIERTGPVIYIIFFTLTGASLDLKVLGEIWMIALILFGVRILSLFIAGIVGGKLSGDSWKFSLLAWMPYVTQAGVGLGLATIISGEFPGWGPEFSTLVISIIFLNQIVGPPFFKWAILLSGEAHKKGAAGSTVNQSALIFGLESQSIALARQLKKHDWKVAIATQNEIPENHESIGIDILACERIAKESFDEFSAGDYGSFICLLSDEENYSICELAYENYGTRNLIVRTQNRENQSKFLKLGALIMDPATAMVSLLEHYVRSPLATSVLLGEDENQDTIEIEIINPDIQGITLRNLRLPADVIILSVSRGDQMIISHGYTRLRRGDIVTLLGSPASLENVRLRMQGY